ncbi:MAG TPA: TetR/AcrR family transcriptional regulator [Fimbriimonas sp.]|nr:TetR/AcrR family transcriptional regulator [Fimbriimonas sp.]
MPRVAACPDVREAVIEAATRLMERYGYRKMTIDDIAQDVGIGKATIYGYFQNKQDVALAVIDGYQRRVRERQAAIAAEPLLPQDRLRRMVLAKVLFAFDTATRYNQSLDDSLATLKTIVLRRRGRYNEAEAELVAGVIAEGLKQGIFWTEDPLATARTILTCISGLMPYSLSSRELQSREMVEATTNQVLDLILQGMYRREGNAN